MRKVCALACPAILWFVGVGFAGPSQVNAQQQVIEQNGMRYVQRTETVQQPTTTITYDERKETVYREQYRTEMVESQQTVLVPVTQYQWEPRIHNWWNPLVPNTIAYHMVPRTRWEARNHTIRAPQTVREIVPEERIVRTQHRQLGFEDQQRTTLTQIGPATTVPAAQIVIQPPPTSQPAASVARQPNYLGGVTKMEGDLPRQSTRPGGMTQYR